MQAAANYWEGMILGNHVVDITYGYLNLDLPILGQADVQGFEAATGRPTVGAVAFDTINNANGEEREWFFDTTPANHSEFSMHQVLVRDLNTQAQNLYYNGTPPELLEVGFWGDYIGADQGTDMLTVALHEIGHILGLSSELPNFDNQTAADGDFDFSSSFVNGASVAAAWFAEDDQDHLRASDATMTSGFARNGDRNLPGATEVFAIASVGGWGGIDLYRKDFLGGTVWDLSGNWEGGRVPDSSDDVYVRHGGDVSILINSATRNLTIRDGSSVSTNDNSLAVSGKLTVEAGPDGSDAIFTVEQGGLITGGELEINVDGRVFVSDSTDYMPGDPVGDRINMEVIDINTGGLLIGNGLIEGDSFVNDGTITGIQPPGNGTFLALAVGVVTPQGVGAIDLDGTSGSGEIFAGLGNVEITSPLTDPFDGEITVGAARTIFFDHPWTFGDDTGPGDGTINLDGGADANSAATIDTAAWTAARGQINVSDFGRIDGTVTFADQIHVDVDTGGFLILSGNSTFEGGTYAGGGTIRFNGPTSIDGNTTMDVAFADLDGAGAEDSEMTIDGGVLTLNVDRIDGPNAPNRYDGTMNINGLFSQLNVQLSDPNASWTMDGELNLNGSTLPGTMGMLEGNDILVTGTINVDGISWISANLDVEGTIDFADASAELGLSVGTRHVIRNTASVTGPGTIDVLGQALLQIENGATVDVDVENRGRLEPGTSVGAATIDGSFLQTGGGTFAVELGGVAVGSGYDRLTVTGSADLGGTLAVSITDAGNGFFVPDVGNSFTVLTAQGGLIDQFNTQHAAHEHWRPGARLAGRVLGQQRRRAAIGHHRSAGGLQQQRRGRRSRLRRTARRTRLSNRTGRGR